MAAAVLQAVIRTEIDRDMIERVSSLSPDGFRDADELRSLSSLASANLDSLMRDRTGAAGTFVAAAAAPNDPAAREVVGDHYRSLTRDFAGLLTELVDRFDRTFDDVNGFDAEAVAMLFVALGDGLILRHRIEPDEVDPDLFGEILIRMFEAVTCTSDETTPPADAVTERLLSGTGTLELPSDSGLDHAKRAHTVDAVRAIYEESGVGAITVAAVARRANVSRGTVIANFGDRCGLAAAVWAHFIPELEQRLTADRSRELPVGQVLERHLHRVIDLAKSHRELTALMLDGMLAYTVRHGAATYSDPADPRTLVPLPRLLVPMVIGAAPYLRPGLADTPAEAMDLATTVTNLTMLRGLSRPNETTSDTVQRIMDLVLEGILARGDGRAGG